MSEREYKYRKTNDGDIIPCDSCGCEVPTALFNWELPSKSEDREEKRALCEICSDSFISRYTCNLPVMMDAIYFTKTCVVIAQVANHLKEQLGLFKDDNAGNKEKSPVNATRG